MDTRQLAAFCAVVERKSFSQAAERLGVTQPAVSLQIRSLEKRLGTQLLDRSGRRVEPTEAGLRVYPEAQRPLRLQGELLGGPPGGGTGASFSSRSSATRWFSPAHRATASPAARSRSTSSAASR